MPTANIFIQSVVLFLQNYYFFFILPNIKSRTLQFSSFCRQNVKTKFSALQFKIGISTHCYLHFIAHVFTFFSTLQRNRILITMQFAPDYSAISTQLRCNQHLITHGLLHQKCVSTDYQGVTREQNFAIFSSIFLLNENIARKSRLQKSTCQKIGHFRDTMIAPLCPTYVDCKVNTRLIHFYQNYDYQKFDNHNSDNPYFLLLQYVTIHLPPLRRLHSRQSIWQLSSVVRPPSHHGVMWSPSMNSMSNSSPQTAHLWPWRSHVAILMLSGKALRSR